MIVYADILVLTNLIVDYFLLAATAKITNRKPPLWRSLSAASLAALGTLIIFLPEQNTFSEIILRLIMSTVICFVAFPYRNIRRLLAETLTFFAVSFCYAGGMTAFYYIMKPSGMAIKNSVVYFDISPVFLICFSVAGFFLSFLYSLVFSRRNKSAGHCFVTLSFGGKKADFSAVIDTGNSLKDPFGGGAVIIGDREKCRRVFGDLTPEKYPQKYRAIPCGTVLGNSVLDGFRCEDGKIITKEKTVTLQNPTLALSAAALCDCDAIVNPADID